MDGQQEGIDVWADAILHAALGMQRSLQRGGRKESTADSMNLRIQGAYEKLGQLLAGTLDETNVPRFAEALARFPLDGEILARGYEQILDRLSTLTTNHIESETSEDSEHPLPPADGISHPPRSTPSDHPLPPGEGRVRGSSPRTRKGRKATGSFFTSPTLIRMLLDATLVPVLRQNIFRAVFESKERERIDFPPIAQWSKRQRDLAEAALLRTKVCDPSCGPGGFLVESLQIMTDWLCAIRFPQSQATADERMTAARCIMRHSIHGADRDPIAIQVARLAMGTVTGFSSHQQDLGNFAVGDSLAVSEESSTANLDWLSTFPDVFQRDQGGFDVVVGNPPFANAIEGQVTEPVKKRLSAAFPELGGTADLAYYFLALAHQLAAPEGAVGLVLPRGVLTGRSLRAFRTQLLVERPPALIFAPRSQYLFPGANVFVVLLALRRNATCLASRDADGSSLFSVTIADDNWWAPLVSDAKPLAGNHRKLAERFEVFASMTTGMAYDLREFVHDHPKQGALRFVTTGLIDPGVCHWGNRTCTYLKRRFATPHVHEEPGLSPSISSRLERVRRPKILVAGLSTRVEAFLDLDAIYCGAVSTYTILHPRDDCHELSLLCEYLNSPEASEHLQRELGAHAMGGGRITLSKDFLRNLPWR